jgi:serine/threonine-protein kinase
VTIEEPERNACKPHAGKPDPTCLRCGILRGVAEALRASRGPDPFLDRTIGSGYVVRRLIGQGGMGSVYEAEQTSLERRVAIKFLKPHLLRDELSTRRFYNEARAASRLNHPNSVAVFDFGATDDGVPFIVMEHLNGADLAELLVAEGAFEPERVCRIARAVLAALCEAHALGICHRDLKPENVILLPRHDGTESVKVVDFGLAKLAVDARLTEPNTVLGTPMYMAPEQFIGRELDGRADLYSLGVLMYELLTGRLPFDSDNAFGFAHQHLTAPPPDPRAFAAIEDGLVEVVLTAMAKKPPDRFATAQAMAQAIEDLAATPAASRGDRRRGRSGESKGAQIPTRLDPAVDELERAMLQQGAASTAVLVGRAGCGRTTSLVAFAERLRGAGYVVAQASGDARTATAAYAPLRELVAALLDGDEPHDASSLALDAIGRAGYGELTRPVGLRGVANASRAVAVAEALSGLVQRAAARSPVGRVALFLDDAATFDELTLVALQRAAAACAAVALFVLVGDEDGLPQWFPHAPRLRVGDRDARLPLHAELIRRLGVPEGAEPPTIAECVALLLDRAEPCGRAAIQAMAVLATPTTPEALAALGCADPARSLEEAVASGLASRCGEGGELHALVRQLVAASIPAEVRRALHDRALTWHTATGALVEARAHHAISGGDGFGALVLLEQAGSLAMQRGDASSAARWFARGLARARRELVASGDETFDDGVLSFTRKLVEALTAGDRLREAEGLVAEAEGTVAPMSPERARLRLLQARIAARRGHPEVIATFEELLRAARSKQDAALTADCARALADARASLGDARGAAEALQTAARALERLDAPLVDRAATAIAMVAALAGAGESAARMRAEIDHALVLARRAGAPALEARALAALGRAHVAEHRSREAFDALDRAVRVAEEAGAVDGLDALRAELAEAWARVSVPAPAPTDATSKRRVVLVVEDDVETQEVLWECLTDQGYEVHAASSGKHALRLLGTMERPVAILVDLMMPVMDGWDFVAVLRDHAAYADIPVTVVSAFADKAPAGVDRLTKPVTLRDLLRVLAAAEARASSPAVASS